MKTAAPLFKFASFLSLACLILAATEARGALLLFDNVSNFRNSVAGAAGSATSSTPNTFMGSAYSLLPDATTITGFDIYPVNLSGTSYNSLQINLFVWGSVNLGTVNASTPAFGNLLGSYSFTSDGTFSSGFYFPFEGSPAGTEPGVILGSPLALSGTTIGMTFNYKGSTDGGLTYNNINSLTSIITYGTPATVGANVFNGYYRNAASETDGNFTSTLRSLGQTNQSLGVRIYGTVPEPGSSTLLLAGGAMLLRRRRK